MSVDAILVTGCFEKYITQWLQCWLMVLIEVTSCYGKSLVDMEFYGIYGKSLLVIVAMKISWLLKRSMVAMDSQCSLCKSLITMRRFLKQPS
jgi:hypothetical protein